MLTIIKELWHIKSDDSGLKYPVMHSYHRPDMCDDEDEMDTFSIHPEDVDFMHIEYEGCCGHIDIKVPLYALKRFLEKVDIVNPVKELKKNEPESR